MESCDKGMDSPIITSEDGTTFLKLDARNSKASNVIFNCMDKNMGDYENISWNHIQSLYVKVAAPNHKN